VEYESHPADDLKRLLAIEAAAITWRDARDEAVRIRKAAIISGEEINFLKVMAPVGHALDALDALLPKKG